MQRGGWELTEYISNNMKRFTRMNLKGKVSVYPSLIRGKANWTTPPPPFFQAISPRIFPAKAEILCFQQGRIKNLPRDGGPKGPWPYGKYSSYTWPWPLGQGGYLDLPGTEEMDYNISGNGNVVLNHCLGNKKYNYFKTFNLNCAYYVP